MAVVLGPGDVVAGKYRVLHEIGRGGMGVVLAAEHLSLPQEVALKVLERGGDDVSLARFEREAHVVVQLRSEHVCRVIDVGRLDGGAPFIVMERLHGEDLATRLARGGPLPVEEAVDYVLQAGEALAEAHVRGVVHRDLKPSNLFLTEAVDGSALVKVLDFGISKTEPAGEGHDLTASGAVLGTPRFMAPEQLVSARRIDHRTDVWALGVVLRELLTGRPAFDGDTAAELFVAILQQSPVALREHAPHVPEGLAAAIDRCLEKDADARHANVGAFALALAPFAPPAARRLVERIVRMMTHHGWLQAEEPRESPAGRSQPSPARDRHALDATEPSGEGGAMARADRSGPSAPPVPPVGGGPANPSSSVGHRDGAERGGAVVRTDPSAEVDAGAATVAATTGDRARALAEVSHAARTGRAERRGRSLAIGAGVGAAIALLAVAAIVTWLGEASADRESRTEEDAAPDPSLAPAPAPAPSPTTCFFELCDTSVTVPPGSPVEPVELLAVAEARARQLEPMAALVLISTTPMVGGAFTRDSPGSVSFSFRYPKAAGGHALVQVGIGPSMLFARHSPDVGVAPMAPPKCPLQEALRVAYAAGLDPEVEIVALWGGHGRRWTLNQASPARSVSVDDDCETTTAP